MTSERSSWVTRYSSRGFPYQVWQPVPWIDPELLDSTVYLYPSEADAEDGNRIGGSGFLVGTPVIARDRSRGSVICVVTNKHVVDSGNMVVRVNTTDGGRDIIPLDEMKWYRHPKGDDLAVCPIQLTAAHRVRYIPVTMFLSKGVIDTFDIGPGDDVFIIGRFVNHEGRQRNIPSVRFGNVSQMPWEPIVIDGFPQESFLVEGRSIAGYSGSPVFLFLPSQSIPNLNPKIKEMAEKGDLKLPGVTAKRLNIPMQLGPWLLGIDYCHLRWDEPIWSKLTKKPVSDDWFIKSNTGMMGVVPAWKLLELLDGPDMKPIFDQAKKAAEEAAKNDSSVELDAADFSKAAPQSTDENPKAREDFTRLVGAAAQKQKPTD